MKTMLHNRKWVLIGAFGLLVILVAVVVVVKNIDRPYWAGLKTPAVLGPDTEVGETRSTLDFVSMTLDQKQYSSTGTLKNTGDKTLRRSDFLTLQILRDGVWHHLEYGSYISTADIKAIEAGETLKIGVWLSLYGDTLKPGHYRAVFAVSETGEQRKTYYLSEEFDVVE